MFIEKPQRLAWHQGVVVITRRRIPGREKVSEMKKICLMCTQTAGRQRIRFCIRYGKVIPRV
jgi:hypothetical protein